MSVEHVPGDRPEGDAKHDMPADDAAWQVMFRRLTLYHAKHGHCFVSVHDRRNSKLSGWLAEQIRLKSKGHLLPLRQAALEGLGLVWDFEISNAGSSQSRNERWEARFAELLAFKKKHGHLNVTKKNQGSAGLMHWRDNQRLRLRNDVMPTGQKARLDAIGFDWVCPGWGQASKEERHKTLWETMFARLLAFKELHGHCQVPVKWKDDPRLGKWVLRQRKKHNRPNDGDGALCSDYEARLEAIGFAWKSDRLTFIGGWEARFAELVAFKEKHGHLRVTKANQASAGLMHWRDNQRLRLKAGTLRDDQKALLDSIGFEWTCPGRPPVSMEKQNEIAWETMFARLLAFKERHGHCQVSSNWKEDRRLASWVARQRVLRRGRLKDEKPLRPDRVARLEAIGFAWKSARLTFVGGWEARFAELLKFKEKYGHLRVTKANQLSAGLMHWRDNQRLRLKAGTLSRDQKKRLDAIGFEWQGPRSSGK